jgi:hypothetical protein
MLQLLQQLELEIRHAECFFIAIVLNVDSVRKYAEI